MSMKKPDTVGWADRPEIRQRIRHALYGICGLLVLAELVVDRHTVMPLERLPAFYPVYGFLALITVVLLAKGLRRLVGRPEGYYGRAGDEHENGAADAEEGGDAA